MFFNGSETPDRRDNYRLLLEASRFADRHGFSSVWTPERHYTTFGGLYPNPSVLLAALARETRRVRLMAGSLVLPLHHPLRVTGRGRHEEDTRPACELEHDVVEPRPEREPADRQDAPRHVCEYRIGNQTRSPSCPGRAIVGENLPHERKG